MRPELVEGRRSTPVRIRLRSWQGRRPCIGRSRLAKCRPGARRSTEELAQFFVARSGLPVGFANSGGLVFVDESTEQIATAKPGRLGQRRRVAAVRWEQLESAVWPVLVVVAAVDAKHLLEMAAAEDEDPIEAVSANSAHPAFGEGVCVRRPDRRVDHLDALRPKDLVERAAELAVAIMDEENRNGYSSSNCTVRLRACWVTQRPSGFEL
jgi:hypothetical protein